MQVSIKFQVAAKSVRHDDDEHSNAILHVYPLLNHINTKHWQVVEEMAIPLEDAPKLSGHRKDDACIASGVTSKAANGGHIKTGQRKRPGTRLFYSAAC